LSTRPRKADRIRVLPEAMAAYASGTSIRAIAQSIGFSYTGTRRMLMSVGVQMRPRYTRVLRQGELAATDPRTVPCAYCGAGAGIVCRSEYGKRLSKQHAARRHAVSGAAPAA
jgi:hypothetical protein